MSRFKDGSTERTGNYPQKDEISIKISTEIKVKVHKFYPQKSQTSKIERYQFHVKHLNGQKIWWKVSR